MSSNKAALLLDFRHRMLPDTESSVYSMIFKKAYAPVRSVPSYAFPAQSVSGIFCCSLRLLSNICQDPAVYIQNLSIDKIRSGRC